MVLEFVFWLSAWVLYLFIYKATLCRKIKYGYHINIEDNDDNYRYKSIIRLGLIFMQVKYLTGISN